MRSFRLIFLLPFLTLFSQLYAQNYTSINSGAWNTPANWNNTSGWGPTTPPLNYSSGTINVNHSMTITGSPSFGGTGFNVAAAATLTNNGNFTFSNGTSNVYGTINVNGNFSVTNGTTNIYGTVIATGTLALSGGATVNVYGTLHINSNANLNANLRIHPGGKVVVEGSVTVQNSNYLVIGTNVAPPPYADMVIYQDLIQQSSGDVTINRNGRLAVFGNVTDSGGGGTFIRVNDGGQVYIHGNITYSGGGSAIQNNNSTNPYGLYVNGTATSTGGGGSVTGNIGDQSTMFNTNPSFASWVASQPNSPLPVTLISFTLRKTGHNEVTAEWATSAETDFDYFVLERSSDAAVFYPVGRIPGAGYNTQTIRLYSFTDKNPLNGTAYYRLKAVDLDGSCRYFHVLSVTLLTANEMTVYPNPSNGEKVRLSLNFEPDAMDKVIVRDQTGAVVLQQSVRSIKEELQFNSPLKPGVYLVIYTGKNFTRSTRLVVQ